MWINDVSRVVSLIQEPPKTTRTAKGMQPKHVLLNVEMCTFCEGAHNVYSCKDLLQMSVADRLREISKVPLCFGCLSKKRCPRARKNSHAASTAAVSGTLQLYTIKTGPESLHEMRKSFYTTHSFLNPNSSGRPTL